MTAACEKMLWSIAMSSFSVQHTLTSLKLRESSATSSSLSSSLSKSNSSSSLKSLSTTSWKINKKQKEIHQMKSKMIHMSIRENNWVFCHCISFKTNSYLVWGTVTVIHNNWFKILTVFTSKLPCEEEKWMLLSFPVITWRGSYKTIISWTFSTKKRFKT